MGYHIDFLPIGEKQCGEAIAIQIGDLRSADRSKKKIIIIDGGYKDDGQKVVNLVRTHYGTDIVDLVVSTHPDGDHINGLTTVLEELQVQELWLHRPWMHSAAVNSLKQMGFKSQNVSDKIEASLSSASDLEAVALRRGVPIYEPFVDQRLFDTPMGRISILGPTQEFYEAQLAEILSYTPKATSLLTKLVQAAAGVFESHAIETLGEGGKTSPQNNTSTVLLLEADNGKRALFAGDAGIEALEQAHEQLVAKYGHVPGSIAVVQVPHHGSRRNVGPSILDKLLGERTVNQGEVRGTAVVSVSEAECQDGHPKKVVTNAFKRRGYPVHPTKGQSKLFFSIGDDRDGWNSPSKPLDHFDYVEGES